MNYAIVVKNKDPNFVASLFANMIDMSNCYKATTRRKITLKILMH